MEAYYALHEECSNSETLFPWEVLKLDKTLGNLDIEQRKNYKNMIIGPVVDTSVPPTLNDIQTRKADVSLPPVSSIFTPVALK